MPVNKDRAAADFYASKLRSRGGRTIVDEKLTPADPVQGQEHWDTKGCDFVLRQDHRVRYGSERECDGDLRGNVEREC